MKPSLLRSNPSFSHLKNPSFIVIEGIDGSGKTTLQKEIVNFLRGRGKHVLATREPGYTELGDQVRTILKEGTRDPKVGYLLVEAARLDLLLSLEETLRHIPNAVIIGDRHSDSSWAYQGALGVEDEVIEALQKDYVHVLIPNITIFLEVRVGVAKGRRQARSSGPDFFDCQKDSFFKVVSERYHQRIWGDRNKYFVVDANRPIEEVTSTVLSFLKEIFP